MRVHFILLIALFSCFNNANLDALELIIPNEEYKHCNSKSLKIEWKNEDTRWINIWITDPFHNNYSLLVSNIDASELSFNWDVPREVYQGEKISIKIEDAEKSQLFDEVKNIEIVDPPIIKQISGESIYCKGDDVYISISASGTNLNYQWYKDDEILENEDSNTLFIDNSDFSHSGVYYCLISNEDCGTIMSRDVSIYVVNSTEIIVEPSDKQFELGETVSFKVEAHGYDTPASPLQFQWYRDTLLVDIFGREKIQTDMLIDNDRISGSKTSLLSIKDVTYFDEENSYYCIVSSQCGSDTSRKARVGQNLVFDYEDIYVDTLLCEDIELTLTAKIVELREEGQYLYSWKKGGQTIHDDGKYFGTKTKELYISSLDETDSRLFVFRVDYVNTNGDTLSAEYEVMDLIVKLKPRFLYDLPEELFLYDNRRGQTKGSFNISGQYWVNDASDEVIEQNLYLNGEFFGDGDSVWDEKYRKNLQDSGIVGTWQVEAINSCGSTWSSEMIMYFGHPDQNMCAGEDFNIVSHNYKSENDFSYRWYKDSIPIQNEPKYLGLNSNNLIIFNLTKEDEGQYQLFVEDPIGSPPKKYSEFALNIAAAPTIEKQFADTMQKNEKGYFDFNFCVISTKSTNTYYQFYENGEKIGPEHIFQNPIGDEITRSILMGGRNWPEALESKYLKAGNTYFVRVWNECGQVVSDPVYIYNPDLEGKFRNESDNNSHSNVEKLSVMPNPTKDYIELTKIKNEEIISISIIDLLGNKINLESSENLAGENLFIPLERKNLPTGNYLILIETKENFHTKKIFLE